MELWWLQNKILHQNYPRSQLLGFSNGGGFAAIRWAIPQIMTINSGQNIKKNSCLKNSQKQADTGRELIFVRKECYCFCLREDSVHAKLGN